MRTTLDISDALLDELRRRAEESRRPLRKVVEETLQRGLAAKAEGRKTVRFPTHAVGIKAPYRGVSMNQLYDQLEAEMHGRIAEK